MKMIKSNLIYQVSGEDLIKFAKSLISDSKVALEEEIRAKQNEKYLTAEEVCEILSCDRSTLWRWAKRGYLVPVKFGNKVRYKKSDIINLMEGE